MDNSEQTLTVTKLPIRLGQLLKLANVVQDGFEARIVIQNEEVLVNDVIETRRGRKIRQGDRITVDSQTWVVK